MRIVQQAIHARPEEMGIYRGRAQRCLEIDDFGNVGAKDWCIQKNAPRKHISVVTRDGKKRGYIVWISPHTDYSACEMDELFWFILTRKGNEMGINTYTMTIVSREPRQIVAFGVDNSVKAKVIQQMVNSTNSFERYYVDGSSVYRDVDYIGLLKQNFEDKSDTHIVEGTNSDIRCYIAGLQRKSRCFFRKYETLKSVLWVFINAYNKFGNWKMEQRKRNPHRSRHYSNHHIHFI